MYLLILKHKKIYYSCLITFVTICMLSLSFNISIWGDEAYSLLIVQKAIPDMWIALTEDVHPFLYYWILKFFVSIFGVSVPVAKMVSILPMVLNMILGATLVDKYFGNQQITVPTLFILMHLACNKFLYMALDIRMYSWALFFVTASGLLAYAIAQDGMQKKQTALFLAASVAAAATHYYALAAVAIIYGMLFIYLILKDKKHAASCALLSLITIVLYLPGVIIFLKQFSVVRESYWIEAMSFTYMASAFVAPFIFYGGIFAYILGAIFFLCVSISLFYTLKTLFFPSSPAQRSKAICILCCVFVFFFLVVLGVAASVLIRPLYINRYGRFTYALFWLGIILAMVHLPSPKMSKYLVATFSICLLFSAVFFIYEEYSESYITSTPETIELINSQEGNVMLASDLDHLTWTVLQFYFPGIECTTYVELDFESMDIGDTVYFFSENELDASEEESLAPYSIEATYLYAGNMDVYDWHLYELTKQAIS